jgi:hypothetical protein
MQAWGKPKLPGSSSWTQEHKPWRLGFDHSGCIQTARARNRVLYIPWGRNRSSLSRLGQLEQPRQQTSSTATPTVTRMATKLPFMENQ